MPTKRESPANGRCQASNKSGNPCGAPAVRGGKYCSLHQNPERAAQLGKKGGGKNSHKFESREVAAPENAKDVKLLLAEAMAEIRGGTMDPKLGTTLGYLGTSLLKAIEVSDFEGRLKRLEEANGLKDTAQETRAAERGGKFDGEA